METTSTPNATCTAARIVHRLAPRQLLRECLGTWCPAQATQIEMLQLHDVSKMVEIGQAREQLMCKAGRMVCVPQCLRTGKRAVGFDDSGERCALCHNG